MATRVYYEVDPFNRLTIKNPPGRKSRVKRFRQVIYGKFGIDSNNKLFYEVSKSQGIDVPQRIKFSGKYSLGKGHNLVITLNKWNNQCEGNRFAINARLIDAKDNEIALLAHSKLDEGKGLVHIIKLSGSWQADRHNRLTFSVQKENGGLDTLALSGAWEINKNNEIIYNYGEDNQALTFRGHWDIKDKCRLRYALDKRINSGFDFTSCLGTLSHKNKESYIVFDIGIAVSKRKKLRRKVIFSGRWKMAKGKELVFETSGAEGSGAVLRFTKEIFDRQAIVYIESIIKEKERFIGAGLTFRW